ncbi:MAG: phage replication initiation protein, NGO0469 family [Flavobacterium sp.]
MALNSNALPKAGAAAKTKYEELDIGNYACRVAQVLDMGVHPVEVWDEGTRKYIKDDTKAPQNFIRVTYEFLTEFLKDKDGVEDETKPRWYSEEIKLLPLNSDLATSTKRYKAIDTKNEFGGDWAQLVTMPCTVTIGHKANGKAKIGNVAPTMKGMVYAELKNPPKVFNLDNPDIEIFKSQPEWIQKRITDNLNFEGSQLQKLLAGGVVPPVKEEPKPEFKEELAKQTAANPW